MIIENKGVFDVSELLEHKANIKNIEFKNISEIINLKLLSDFKLLTELKFSTCLLSIFCFRNHSISIYVF